MDQIQDRNRVLLARKAGAGEVPEYVLDTQILTEKEADALPDSAFADREQRMFPIHTRGDTWMSLAYLNAADPAGDRKTVRKLIDKAAALWKIPDEDVRRADVPLQKAAAAEPECVIRFTEKGQEFHRTAVSSVEDLQKVAEDLHCRAADFTFQTRCSAARQILQAQDRFGRLPLELRRELQKTACYGFGTPERVLDAVLLRQQVLPKVASDIERLSEVADELRNITTSAVPPQALEKLAAILDAADAATDMKRKYGSGQFRLPEQSLVAFTKDDLQLFQKHAAALPDGSFMPVEELKRSRVQETLKNMLGIEAEDDQLRETLEALPPVVWDRVKASLKQV